MRVTRTPLRISYDADTDVLIAFEYSAVIDGIPQEQYVALSEWFAFVLRQLGDAVCGIVVEGASECDPGGVPGAIWDGPRFDVPTLGLKRASAGEIILAADAALEGASTHDVHMFDLAVAEKDRDLAEGLWRACLECGEMKAHFGLGYTLFELERYQEAYSHLRYYTSLCPRNSWAWCWYGKAAREVGEVTEARRAFERAIACEERGGEKTDAGDLLAQLSRQ